MIPALLAALLICAPTAAAPSPPAQHPEEVARLESWPELSGSDARQVKTDVQRLRKARTPEMADEAEGSLIMVGAGAAPALLAALSKERGEEPRARLEAMLDAITGAEHTRLLAPEFDSKSGAVRTWALRRCGAFPDEGIRSAAEAALARVVAAAAKKEDDDAARDELYAAALCTTATGSTAGLKPLAEFAEARWAQRGRELRVALGAARGEEATRAVAPLLREERRETRLCGLRMLGACGDESAISIVRPFLDEEDNTLRVGAINALRGIVDGEEPLEKLPVFRAIELAKEWKGRV